MERREWTSRCGVSALLLGIWIMAGAGYASGAESAPADEPSPNFRLPSDTRPLEYQVKLEVDQRKDTFAGTQTIRVQLDKARRTLWLHGRSLDVTGATVDGRPARYRQVDPDGLARLSLEEAVGPGEVELRLTWTQRFGTQLQGIFKVTTEGTPYAFTQFEAIFARDAMPCFDEPGFKTPFQLIVVINPEDRVVANTPESSRKTLPDGRLEVAFDKTLPLPTYLLAFAVGPFDIVDGPILPPDSRRSTPLPIRGVAVKGRGANLRHSLAVSGEALAALETYFDLPYAYGKMDIVAVPDFVSGGMENPGLVTFKEELLLIDASSPVWLQKANVYIIVHELAHQWVGNLVTFEWWNDLWLNEALASFMETPIISEMRPSYQAATVRSGNTDWVTGQDSLVSARQIRQPVASKADIITAFDSITYTKGAAVVAMFEGWMGADAFRKGLRDYLVQHAHGSATATDLLSALATSSGKDVATPFLTFLDQPGVPYVVASLRCDSSAHAAVVDLQQWRFLPVGTTGDRNRVWQLPVCVRFESEFGLKTACTLLAAPTGSLPLDTGFCPRLIHPNADAVGYYRWALPAEQLKAMAGSGSLLTASERISFANAVRAAAWTGTITFADALDSALPLATDNEPTVADTPYGLLAFALESLVEPAQRPACMERIATAFLPVVQQLTLTPKPDEEPSVRERRNLALYAVVDVAGHRETTEEVARLGRTVLGLDGGDGKIHLDLAPADLVGLAITSAVRTGGEAVFAEVSGRLGVETDSLVRSYYLWALGSVREEPLSARALDLVLDGRLRVTEILIILTAQAADFRTRDAAWDWTKRNFEALVQKLPEEFGSEGLPGLFAGYCTEEKAVEIEAFLAPWLKHVPTMERPLAQALENIRICAAKKALHEKSAREYFSR